MYMYIHVYMLVFPYLNQPYGAIRDEYTIEYYTCTCIGVAPAP